MAFIVIHEDWNPIYEHFLVVVVFSDKINI